MFLLISNYIIIFKVRIQLFQNTNFVYRNIHLIKIFSIIKIKDLVLFPIIFVVIMEQKFDISHWIENIFDINNSYLAYLFFITILWFIIILLKCVFENYALSPYKVAGGDLIRPPLQISSLQPISYFCINMAAQFFF